jgi:uncharacterized protein
MTRIGLISDTHNYLDAAVFDYFRECEEIWHAGDVGTAAITDELEKLKPVKAVYGNIDGYDIRSRYPETLVFECEEVKVLMNHIGAAPPKYNKQVKPLLEEHRPKLFICGRSHILKIQYDAVLQCLYMNPGAAGVHGWHKVRTLVRFTIDKADIKDCEVIELGSRGRTEV